MKCSGKPILLKICVQIFHVKETCSQSFTGFNCALWEGYCKPRCNMDDFACRYKWCSGHGECVKASNSNNFTCDCEAGWTGSKCEFAIPSDPEQLTIGQKLLKEPIWIGMIVMLNLVLFFCVSYVARRKCGKKISRLMPKWKKKATPECPSKEVSHSREESSTATRDIYSLHIELPRSENSSKSPTSKTPTKFLFEKVDTSAPPTPNVISEKKKEAALRFFEAYKSNNPFPPRADARRLSRSLDAPPGMQDGTLSFLERPGGLGVNDSSPPMIRSYTISTVDYEEPSAAKKRWKNLLRHTRSFPGSPREVRKAKSEQQEKESSSDSKQCPVTVKNEHCYPVIRILNENDNEEHLNSDSENSILGVVENCDTKTMTKTPNENHSYVRTTGSADSGYPTTPASSHIAKLEERYDAQESRSQSANERRKLFSNKAKSKSFYDISYGDGHFSAETSSFSTDMDNDTKAIGIRRSIPNYLDNLSSFDSGLYCMMCRRDRQLNHAETYSCESELNRLHRPDRSYSSDSRIKRRCNCRKCRQRNKSHCRKHIRQFSRELSSLNMNHRHASDQNLRTYKHRPRRLSVDKLFCTVSSSRSFQEHSNNTSTESEACDCSRSRTRTKRKCYRYTNHYSDGSWTSRHKRPDLASAAHSSASWEQCKEKTYPRRRAPNYLTSDRFSGHSLENVSLSFDSRDRSRRSLHGSVNHLNCNQEDYHSQQPSLGSSKSHTPMSLNDLEAIDKTGHTRKPPTLTDVEVVSTRLSDETDFASKSLDKLETTVVDKFYITSQSSSSSDKVGKDSAYQTKQSSMDRYNSMKDRTGPKSNATRTDNTKNDDKVRRHLHQAAQKLAMIKRFQAAQEQFSKDSAVYTFSEDDLSTDDQDSRSPQALVKRTGGLAFQMKEMYLSEVKEECSGMSHGSYNTPNNEPSTDQPDKFRDEHKIVLPLTTFCKPEQTGTCGPDISFLEEAHFLEETKV